MKQTKEEIQIALKDFCRSHGITQMVCIFETEQGLSFSTAVAQVAIPIENKSPFYTYIFDQLNEGVEQGIKTKQN